MLNKAGNFLAFQVGWFACVLGAAHDHPWLGPLVVLFLLGFHFWLLPDSWTALRPVLLVGCIGTIIDSMLGYVGILQFRDSVFLNWFCPPWLIALWLIFATTLRSSLNWLVGRYWIAAVLGGIFGPISYYAGQALGAFSFGVNTLEAGAILLILWTLLLPSLVRLVTRKAASV